MVLKIKKKNLKNNLVTVLLIANTLFGAYSFFYIGTYAVTVFILLALILLVFSILKFGNIKRSSRSNPYAIAMIIYLVINFVLTGMKSVTALVLSCSFFVLYIISYRKADQNSIEKSISIFQITLTFLAVYGIYQFIGRLVGLPFTDIVIERHMVQGYNWTNQTNFMGLRVFRSNAIFVEPSIFSQFLSLNILLYIQKNLESKIDITKKLIVPVLLNGLALICTLSGTGIIILVMGFFVQFLNNSKKKRKFTRYIKTLGIITVFLIIVAFFFDLSPIVNYFLVRFEEILYLKENNKSGYIRFTGAFQIMFASLKQFPIVGCGIGNIREMISGLQNVVVESNGYVANGIVRVGSELGIVGIIIWIMFLVQNMKQTARLNPKIWIIMLAAIIMNLTHEAFSSNYFWSLLLFSNVWVDKEEST